MVKRERLVIKCKTKDVAIAFKVLAISLDEDHEETLKQLLKLEKEHPLQKISKGVIVHL